MYGSIIAAAAVVLLVTGCSSTRAPQTTGDGDAEQITGRLAAYDAANNRGDLDGVMSLFTEDAIMMAPDQPAIVGKAAIKEVIRGWVSAGCSVTHRPAATESFGTVVIHRGTATGTCHSTGASFDNKYLHIYQRQSDGALLYWRGASNTNAPPP